MLSASKILYQSLYSYAKTKTLGNPLPPWKMIVGTYKYLHSFLFEKFILSGIGCLPCLESLELSRNEIKEIPTSIGDLPKLKSLHLSHNNLKSLPTGL